MKRFLACLLAAVMAFATIPALGDAVEYSNIKIYVNGIRIALFDANDDLQQAAIIDGVIYLPIESLISGIGGSYEYDSENGTININLNNFTVADSSSEPSVEDDLESKAYTWSSFRDSYIENGKKAANAFMSYARKYFKNPSSIRVEQAYWGTYYYLLDISAENSYGGRTREYYFVNTDDGFEVDQPMSALINSYKTLGSEIKGDDFAWFSSLFK